MAKFASVDVDDGYFRWVPYYLSTFIFALIFGIFTLFGGAWWIKTRYTPKAKASSVQFQLAAVWTVWLFTILFYILSAYWSAASARVLALTLRTQAGRALALDSGRARIASAAFLSFSSAGWMVVLLIQVYILWTKLTPARGQNRVSITLFLPALGLLGCSAVFGGIVLPAYLGRPFAADMKDYTIFSAVAASLLFIASCILLFSVMIVRKKTLGKGQSEPLRKVIVVLSLWIITGLISVVFAALIRTFSLPFDPSILLFGISSLATILILPDTFVRAESSKLGS